MYFRGREILWDLEQKVYRNEKVFEIIVPIELWTIQSWDAVNVNLNETKYAVVEQWRSQGKKITLKNRFIEYFDLS